MVKKFASDGSRARHLQRLPDLASRTLPALMRNAGLKYICKQVYLRTERPFSLRGH